jgi:hypothetical protein
VPPYPLPEQYFHGEPSDEPAWPSYSEPSDALESPDEALPPPQQAWSSDDVEIITDQ